MALIPVAAGADISLVLKTALTGFTGGTPTFAIQVSQARYRIGLVQFLLPLVFNTFEPYAPGILIH